MGRLTRRSMMLMPSSAFLPKSLLLPADTRVRLSGGSPIRKVKSMSLKGYCNAVAWNFDGSRLAVLSNFGGDITIFDASSWQEIQKFSRGGFAYSGNSFAYLPDGTLLTSAGAVPDHTEPTSDPPNFLSLIQWDPSTGSSLEYIPDLGRPPPSVPYRIRPADVFVVSPDAGIVAGINGQDVMIFRVKDWSLQCKFSVRPTPKHPDFPMSIAISPDSRCMVVGTGFGYVHVYEIGNAAPFVSFAAFPGDAWISCSSLGYDSDGQLLAVGSGGASGGELDIGRIRLWSTKNWAVVARLTGRTGSVRSVGWSSDRKLAVGDDWGLRIWQIDGIKSRQELSRETRPGGFSIAFSCNDILAVACGRNVEIYRQ